MNTPERVDFNQREIVDVRVKGEVEFPTEPEKRFEALFSAIGNSETKCLTLLCLTQSPITAKDLHQRFLQASGLVWKTGDTLQKGYCLETLIPIGLVVEADTLYIGAQEYVTGLRLTQAGLRFGQPIAAFLLEQSSRLPYSLLEVFGPTSKGGGETRAVLTRAAILKILASRGHNLRRVDIARRLGLDGSPVGNHLRHLAKLSLIHYSSINTEEKGFAPYLLVETARRENVQQVGSQRSLTADVADLLFELKMADCNQLWEILKNKYPNRSEVSLITEISSILSALAKQGICQPELYVGSQILSQATITEAGARIVREIIAPVKKTLAEDETLLTSLRQIPWQNLAKEAILKYKEASGHTRQRPTEDWLSETMAIIKKNPGLRPKEIQSNLGSLPTNLLRMLLQQGQIRKEKQGKAVRYFPAP